MIKHKHDSHTVIEYEIGDIVQVNVENHSLGNGAEFGEYGEVFEIYGNWQIAFLNVNFLGYSRPENSLFGICSIPKWKVVPYTGD